MGNVFWNCNFNEGGGGDVGIFCFYGFGHSLGQFFDLVIKNMVSSSFSNFHAIMVSVFHCLSVLSLIDFNYNRQLF